MSDFNVRFLAKLSLLAFGIYLFQMNQIIWNNVLKDAFVVAAEQLLYIGILLVFSFVSEIFLSRLFVEFVRSKLAKIFSINELSNWIVEKADFVLENGYLFEVMGKLADNLIKNVYLNDWATITMHAMHRYG